mgnify:CR=1 FL=1
MIDSEEIGELFSKITEEFEEPVRIGSRCESQVYYRVEDLSDEDLNVCARYVGERILEVGNNQFPDLILKLPGGFSFFAERLAVVFSELNPSGKEVPLEQYLESKLFNGHGERYKGCSAVLVTDVITTARSSLEAHTKATLRGINIFCWAALIAVSYTHLTLPTNREV